VGISEPLRFKRLALAFHMYSSASTVLSLVGSERARTRTLQRGGPAWIMDEFGASVADTAGVDATTALADGDNLSWTYWSGMQLHDPTGDPNEGLINEQTRRPYGPMADVLATPYPWATAGRPGPQSFDPMTGLFQYEYRASHSITAPTEIMLPRRAYPHGYRVLVNGARVVSARRATLLELRARPGATTVHVRVLRAR
jgi:hypothetical protein